MKYQLDPIFETLFLLSVIDPDKDKEAAIEQLNDFGFDGAVFFEENLQIVERYQLAFDERRVENPGTKMLEEFEGAEVIGLYLAIFIQYPEFCSEPEKITPEKAAQAIRSIIEEPLEEEGYTLVRALEEEESSDQSKWQTMALVQQPQERLMKIGQAVRDNIPAFEYACSQIKPDLDELLRDFEVHMEKGDSKSMINLGHKFDLETETVPALVIPAAALIFGSVYYYGLFSDRILNGEKPGITKEEVLVGAKSLSDSSKIEILLALRNGSMYNLEIAEKVGLTPATVSHHMNLLLVAGFVEIEKREGKVFSRLSETGVERFLKGIQDLLLG